MIYRLSFNFILDSLKMISSFVAVFLLPFIPIPGQCKIALDPSKLGFCGSLATSPKPSEDEQYNDYYDDYEEETGIKSIKSGMPDGIK